MAMSIFMRETTPCELAGERAALPMDEEAFRAFYERTARPLWAYLSRVTRDRELTADLFQETYYRMCRAGATYESEAHRRNALFHIATNLHRDHGRRWGGVFHVAIENAPPAERSGEMVLRRLDLARALDELEPRQREMIWLAYAQGASHAEIAEICGVRAASVRTILLRARRKMAAFLEKRSEERP
ncbi:MAG TPA: RNA polymerase sigma factor [Thermoanaerobaculia bacterium]|nr:RNA polymerase sigma factor [Thermoanaerobaculia bacterium]